MKKKALALVLALVMAFSLTGCLAEEIDISFKEDGSGSVRAAVYFSDAFLEQMGQTAEEAFKDDEGTPVKKTIDGQPYSGIEQSETFSSIEELSKLLTQTGKDTQDAATFAVESAVVDGKTLVTVKFALTSEDEAMGQDTTDDGMFTINMDGDSEAQLEQLASAIHVTMSISFPDGIKRVDGDKNMYTIDGNTIKINAASGSTEQDLTIIGSLGDALVIAPQPEMDSDIFVEVNKYDGRFNDVPTDAWYAKELERAYNIGIINGTSNTGYDPNGTLTKAQVVVMAARLHSLYTKDIKDLTIITGGQTWYQPYVEYAIQNGIIEKDAFTNFDTFASRAEMAYVFAHALPSEAYASSSQKADFNDVDKTNQYYSSVMALYNAGIVNGIGNENYGPNDTVTRAQAAVFVTRLSTPSYRVA